MYHRNLTPEQEEEIYRRVKEKKEKDRENNREAYEQIRQKFMYDVFGELFFLEEQVTNFHKFLLDEVEGFQSVMKDYGKANNNQRSFTIKQDNLKLEVKSNRVKKFDERADMAAIRLVDFLKDWVKKSDKGTDDPMYQLAMMSIGRNQKGDLDYKQVSNLYKLEDKFNDSEYSAIMELFRESHIVEGTATHFYFYKKDDMGIWKRVEISFNRL